MFGKDYDKEINDLYKKINDMAETNNRNNEIIIKQMEEIRDLLKENQEGSQETFLTINKVIQSHKKAIELLSKR